MALGAVAFVLAVPVTAHAAAAAARPATAVAAPVPVLRAVLTPARAAAPAALPGRYALGVRPGAVLADVVRRIGVVAGVPAESLAPVRALVVTAGDPRRLARVPGVAWVEPVIPRRSAFVPSDPLLGRQWYVQADRAFDYWSALARPPALAGVRVAVIDSGIDLGHPDFRGRIAAARSFVGGSAQDTDGHGTFVAGVIAARLDDQVGIAGMAFPAQLLVAKVVGADGTISPESEARAIRWAVASGARIINMSIGGLRDPRDPERDTYSKLEAAAVGYAIGRGAVVVAAVGNADDAPAIPWPFASYPAALPHVIGVAALTRKGDVSTFSNRDPVFVDIAAPGEGILSTFPRALTATRAGCVDQGYSSCGPSEYREAEGTSFGAPQVTAAIATVLSFRPRLTARQAAAIVERTARDVHGGTGCRRCPLLRDQFTGWGALDVEAALRSLAGPPPPADPLEPNDGAAVPYALWGLPRTVAATIDYWDDPVDVYRVRLARGQALIAKLDGPTGVQTELSLWLAASPSVDTTAANAARYLVSLASGLTDSQRLVAVAPAAGFYLVAVRAAKPGSGSYTLRVSSTTP